MNIFDKMGEEGHRLRLLTYEKLAMLILPFLFLYFCMLHFIIVGKDENSQIFPTYKEDLAFFFFNNCFNLKNEENETFFPLFFI